MRLRNGHACSVSLVEIAVDLLDQVGHWLLAAGGEVGERVARFGVTLFRASRRGRRTKN